MEETLKLMPVAEAIAITNKKAITEETIARGIKNAAENGQNRQRYFDILFPFDIMQALIKAGYQISQNTGLMGENIIVISW